MFDESLKKIIRREALSENEMQAAVTSIMSDQIPDAKIAAFLAALSVNGESSRQIAGCARSLRNLMVRVNANSDVVVDTCGTGGDGKSTFNVSTCAAFVVASAGVKVAKHGNRSVSSRCGSADVLEKLGCPVEISKERAEQLLSSVGFAFLFAPAFHPAMKRVAQIRRELGFRTIFNLVGPLANPASANVQLIGVPDAKYLEEYSKALALLGTRRSWVIHSRLGTDELLPGVNEVRIVTGRKIRTSRLDTKPLGLRAVKLADISGCSAEDNAVILLNVLKGEKGPHRDAVILNAGAAMCLAGRAKNVKEGIGVSANLIDAGSSLKLLETYRNPLK